MDSPSPPPSPPIPPSPFAPAPAGELWAGTIEFDLKVKFSVGSVDRRPNGPQVADAVQVALANAEPTPYPLGRDGLSIAGPVESVSGSTKADAGRRLQTGETEIFTITVVALGPLLQPISKVVRNLDFINAVREALADAGRTSIYQKENAPIFAANFAAEKMGSPYTAADFTVTAVQNVDGVALWSPYAGVALWSVSVEVDAPDNATDAQSAAEKLSATKPELETALRSGRGSVKSIAPAAVAADTISWSFDVELDAPLEVVGQDKFTFALQDVPSPSPPSGDDSSRSLVIYALTGILGLFGLTLIVLLVVSCFTEKAKPQPNRTGTPSVDGPVGWGPCGFLFPKSWVYVWWGYLAMVVLSGIVFPAISESLPLPSSNSETIETILIIGPFIHCILMPILWVHKHREDKKWIENHLNEDVVVMTELDPEAKTTIFSRKLACAKSCTVLLFKLTFGLVDLALRVIKYATGGTINLSAFWFPAPFYTFWKAKLQIDLIQVDGAKICTNANQGDAYMKFCTEAMLNWWTLGIYGKCCGSRTSYGRWLDRHVLWQGAPPSGYTNRELAPFELAQTPSPPQTGAPHAGPRMLAPVTEFRIFDERLSCCQKLKVYLFTLLLTLLGGFLTWLPYAAPAQTSET